LIQSDMKYKHWSHFNVQGIALSGPASD